MKHDPMTNLEERDPADALMKLQAPKQIVRRLHMCAFRDGLCTAGAFALMLVTAGTAWMALGGFLLAFFTWRSLMSWGAHDMVEQDLRGYHRLVDSLIEAEDKRPED